MRMRIRRHKRINGVSTRKRVPTRGLCQGDPLSPYLNILCAEGFSYLLRQAEVQKSIHGVATCRSGPRISHLFFADDSLIFARATEGECKKLLEIIHLYEEASGQVINIQKSSLFFSPNISEATKQSLLRMMGVGEVQAHDKYLGLPSMVGRSKKQIFGLLKDRMWKKIRGWKENFLSKAGREILLKSVGQAIPTYAMSCFLLPKTLCEELNAVLARFWWCGGENERKIHWTKWENLCKAKENGGLGFRNFEAFNLALVAKQGWRLLNNQNNLFYRVFKAKYFPRGSILDANLGYYPSYAWRSIYSALDVLRDGVRWRVGNGSEVHIWHDKWLQRPLSFKPITPPQVLPRNARVIELVDPISSTWDTHLLERVFMPVDIEEILKIPISTRRSSDTRIWHWEINGDFTVRSAYRVAQRIIDKRMEVVHTGTSSDQLNRVWWKKVWSSNIPNKVKHFVWRSCMEVLPVGENLEKRSISYGHMCRRCGDAAETIFHALISCPYAQSVWRELNDIIRVGKYAGKGGDFLQWMMKWRDELAGENWELGMICLWVIWNDRNAHTHGNKTRTPKESASFAKQYSMEFLQSCGKEMGQDSILEKDCIRWTPPPNDTLKINVDGAIFQAQQYFGIGVVIRGGDGEVYASMVDHQRGVPSPQVVEAYAMRTGIQVAQQCGFKRVILESDNEALVKALQHNSGERSEVGDLLEDIRQFAMFFDSFSVSHVKRMGNRVAHTLARSAMLFDKCKIWIEEVPDLVLSLIQMDKPVA